MLVGELSLSLVPTHLKSAPLHLMIKPRATEHQLAKPVDKRLAANERHTLPVAAHIPAKTRLGLRKEALRRNRDEIGDLLRIKIRRIDQPELDRCCDNPLLKVTRVEREAVPQKLDDVVVSGRVVRVRHDVRIARVIGGTSPGTDAPAATVTA